MSKLFLFTALAALLAAPASDTIDTSKGPLNIYPVNHASLVMTWNGTTIYMDPYGGSGLFREFSPADLILITDIHQDHLDASTLQALDTRKATIIAPQAVAEQLPDALRKQCEILKNGGRTTQREIVIEAIPMYNLPETKDAAHPKGRGNGYVLEMGGKRIYVSGDSEDIREMRALRDIDVAFICMNLPYTMDVDQAAGAVLEFKPKVVYPYHYRGKDGMSDVSKFKSLVQKGDPGIEVRLRDWYPGQ